MQKPLREEIGKVYRSSSDDRTDPYSPHAWWIFDPRETSPKTCPTCISLSGSHYRGDELFGAFPYHIQRTANSIRAYVHPHCRCRLIWAGYTKDVMNNPYGTLKTDVDKIEVPEKIDLSPSQKRMFDGVARFSRETWRHKHESRKFRANKR